MAKRLCGTVDRFDQAGLSGPRRLIWRAASSPPARIVSKILQRGSHAFIAGQGCTGFAGRPDRWPHHCQAAPGRIAPSIRPDLISGRDRSATWPVALCRLVRTDANDRLRCAAFGDDLSFHCRGANGCIDSWDACPVIGTGEVTASSNTAKQRFADISPNCASKPKSMTPSGKIATTSPRCRIASRSKPQGENVPKFQ